MKATRRPYRPLLLLLPLALLPLLSACLRSRIHITSEPSGAEVTWRGEPYGATPVTIPFLWYWYYDVSVSKPGYVPVDRIEALRTPPWFLMPFDLLLEIIPIPIPDNRYRHYVLQPKPLGEAAYATDRVTTSTLQPTLQPPNNATPNRVQP